MPSFDGYVAQVHGYYTAGSVRRNVLFLSSGCLMRHGESVVGVRAGHDGAAAHGEFRYTGFVDGGADQV